MPPHPHDTQVALSLRLRGAIAHTHETLEQTPLACALASGALSRSAYAPLAWQMWHLHRRTESAFDAAAEAWAPLRALWQPSRRRLALIEADLRAIGAGQPPVAHEAVVEAGARLAEGSVVRPWSLVGPLYVLEGSRLGSALVGRALATGWGTALVPGIGLDYHRPPASGWWADTVRALDALPLDVQAQADACEEASALMRALETLYLGLLPHPFAPVTSSEPVAS